MLLQRKGEEKKEWGSDNVSSKLISKSDNDSEGTMETLEFVEK